MTLRHSWQNNLHEYCKEVPFIVVTHDEGYSVLLWLLRVTQLSTIF